MDILTDKIYNKTKNITRDKKGYFIMIKESMYQKDITSRNIDAPSKRTPKYKTDTQLWLSGGPGR